MDGSRIPKIDLEYNPKDIKDVGRSLNRWAL